MASGQTSMSASDKAALNNGRSTTPTPKDNTRTRSTSNTGIDHSISHIYGKSVRTYPPDCPTANVVWFHAVDVPKRKPQLGKHPKPASDQKVTQPKKFVAFSTQDSRSIEFAYQRLVEELEDGRTKLARKHRHSLSADSQDVSGETESDGPNARVPVNEDFLFEVDIAERELAPAYWLGPTYEVRRGSWFYQEGSALRPCEENLAAQLEEGYLKIQPWRYPELTRINTALKDSTPKGSSENLKATASAQASQPATQHQPQTYRLFGIWMSNVATYHDASTAWLSSEGVLSWVTSTMYERFAGGGYMSGIKLVRGYTEPKKATVVEEKRPMTPPSASQQGIHQDERQQRLLKRRSAPPAARSDSVDTAEEKRDKEPENPQSRLTRQLSTMLEDADTRDPDKQEEKIRQREEQQIQDDYSQADGEVQGREIEHLILVTHGIGQLLGLKMDSINFVHDVNILRKSLKSVYSNSVDLKALNGEIGEGPGNCRIQVLPVCWRHLLDFPRRRERQREHDLGEADVDEDEYPSLEDITIEGVAFARSLISDLALDVLLYQSAYREQISRIVLDESNRIHKLFLERNAGFKGQVHIMGHSLGSAIMFDILCRQKETPKATDRPRRNPLRFWPAVEQPEPVAKDPRDMNFEFDVKDFYCLGSPVGLFQMLKGRTIAARHLPHAAPSESPLGAEPIDDPFLKAQASGPDSQFSPVTGLPLTVSSPKVSQLFNIFHPSDPISYRMEPLISPAMSSLKPQALPYTKKGIFGSVAPQGLSGIGSKVGQSVSGLWSSLSAGIASSLLNRSLGLTNEDVANMSASASQAVVQQQQQQQLSPGAGTNITSGGVITSANELEVAERKRKLAEERSKKPGQSADDPILIDDEIETLYSKFQKKRIDLANDGGDVGEKDWESERKAQKLRSEEVKVRALNRNGRVDYNIQESVLDFNPINTIASHMSYWADEDVSHFVMSQLLSGRSDLPKKQT